ncbi:hypothetical protein GCM10023189_01450 [Nibrella saemangeumensis]|uniref:MORN repeat-containing protein n=1 Tax=Nibrella saemangeumensis TaxID=1084526 RepID=A0ABP8MCH9_9BACT
MNSYTVCVVAGLITLSAFVPAPAPQSPPTNGNFVCNYSGINGLLANCNYVRSASNGHAEKVVERILKPIGLMRNFKIIECPNTQNCFATVVNGQRYIIYDGAFMQRIETVTETDWSAISIMAHEIGHHLQGHTIDGRGGQPQKELEADKFSGFVLHQLGASLEESLVAIRALGNEHPTPTHPAKLSRVEHIRKGWLEAEEMYPRTKTAGRPAPATIASSRPAPATPVDNKPASVSANRVGCLSGNCLDGKGVFMYPTRERYEGDFDEGDKHGAGTEYYADGKLKYKGGFKDDVRSGTGIYYYRNGDRYAGQFVNNTPNGRGTYYFADGDRFNGYFRNGRRHGPGILYNAEGTEEERGLYENDEKIR